MGIISPGGDNPCGSEKAEKALFEVGQRDVQPFPKDDTADVGGEDGQRETEIHKRRKADSLGFQGGSRSQVSCDRVALGFFGEAVSQFVEKLVRRELRFPCLNGILVRFWEFNPEKSDLLVQAGHGCHRK